MNNDNIGKQYPFIDSNKKKSFSIEDVLSEDNTENFLNLNAIFSICSVGYIYGDDTLIKDVKREEWLTPKIIENFNSIKKNQNDNLSSNAIAEKLKVYLKLELNSYIKPYNKIGIMLSGGLDSRIVAGILKELISEKKYSKEVTVYNWGLENSRDVIYSREIADRYQWNYKFMKLDAEMLKENFFNNLDNGCEVSPLHLHCMKLVSDDLNSDVVIGGTYGDSIGRGLFSGKHVSEIERNNFKIKNNFGIFKEDFFDEAIEYINEQRFKFTKQVNYNTYELEYYANYLRRMLTNPMNLIHKKKPVFQLFTDPEVYKFMLSLKNHQRSNEIYKVILKSLPQEIGNIPYAKDGKVFIHENGKVLDNYYSKSHKYGKWLREDLQKFVISNLDLELLYQIGIFKTGSLEKLLDLWKLSTNESNNKLDEVISYLTNLCIFVKKYNIRIKKNNYQDGKVSRITILKNLLYVKARNIKRI